MRRTLRGELHRWNGDQSIPLSLSVWQRIGAVQEQYLLALRRRPDAQHDNMHLYLSERNDLLLGKWCTGNMCNELSGWTGAEQRLSVHLPDARADLWTRGKPGVLPGEPDLRPVLGSVCVSWRAASLRSDELLRSELPVPSGTEPVNVSMHLSFGASIVRWGMRRCVPGWPGVECQHLYLYVSRRDAGLYDDRRHGHLCELFGEPGTGSWDLHLRMPERDGAL